MRLLNTRTGRLAEFNGSEVPKYAILSHRWGDDEQTFKEVDKLSRKIRTRVRALLQSLPQGLSPKLRRACEFAASLGFDWIWVDTCCIDKASSAELSEAINSMFAFYSSADVCITYLVDVPDDLAEPTKEGSEFWKSSWFTRGWTLQELIASRKVLFVSQGWKPFGNKEEMAETLEAITGINKEVLKFTRAVSSVSIAERMSWAAGRVTTRVEDRAYSLLGIFGVYMSTLYGEGTHAFRRLQEELLRSSPDQTLFAWGFSETPRRNWQVARLGLFADYPERYAKNDIQGLATITIEDIPKAAQAFLSAVKPPSSASLEQHDAVQPIPYDTPAYSTTNYGIRARVPLVRRSTSTNQSAIAILAVRHDSSYVGLVIHRLSQAATNHYAVGQRGYRLVRVGAPDNGAPSPSGWANDLGLVHDDVTVRWEDIYITTTEPWLAQISLRPSVVDMSLNMVSTIPASEPDFLLLTSDQHAIIALRCLSLMNDSLRQDLCDIGDPSLRNQDVHDLAGRIAKKIPEELQHACRLWLTHLPLSSPNTDLLQELSTFARAHLLHWVEALSLFGELRVALVRLPGISDWLREHAHAEEALFRDADRMIRAHYDVISASALDLYHRILTFNLPDCDLLRKFPPKVKLLSPRRGWTAVIGEMKGYEGRIESVAFMPDGVHIISGSEDGSVSMWNYQALERVTTFIGHHRAIHAVTCSPDGRLIASCGSPADVALWDVGNGTLLRVLAGQGPWQRAVAFSADSMHIAAGSDDGSVRVWSVDSGERIHTFTGHTDWVRTVAFSPADGTMLASGSNDGTIKIWNIATGDVVRDLRTHKHWVMSVAISLDGSRIVSGSSDGWISIWDAATDDAIRTIRAHTEGVRSVAFTPHGSSILSSSRGGTIRKWDATTGHCLSSFTSSHGAIVSGSLSQDGSRVASVSADSIQIWDANVLSESTENLESKRPVPAVDFAPDGETFATSSLDGTVRLWKTSTTDLLHAIHYDCHVSAVRFSPDGAILAAASYDATIRLFEAGSWVEVGRLTWQPDLDPGWMRSLAFSTDGSQIACGTYDSVAVWDIGSRERISVFRVEHQVDALAFSPDMTHIATGLASEDAGAYVWDIATGGRVALVPGPCHRIHSLEFSPDSDRIVLRQYDGRVSICTIPSPALHGPLPVDADEAPLRFSWQPDSAGEQSLGWLHFTAGPGLAAQPVCWFPAERRPHFYRSCYAWHGDVVVVGSENGTVTVVDLTEAVRSL